MSMEGQEPEQEKVLFEQLEERLSGEDLNQEDDLLIIRLKDQLQTNSQQSYSPDSLAQFGAYCSPMLHHSLPFWSSAVWVTGDEGVQQ